MTYDAWKLRAPDWDQPDPECRECDDAGCPACCPTQTVTLDDLDEAIVPLGAYQGREA